MNEQSLIHTSFEAQVEKAPSHIAAVCAGQSVTYRELNEQANQLALYLRESGIKPDAPVAICMERSIGLLVSILGILKAGGAYVPLDPSHPDERRSFILRDCHAAMLITKSGTKTKWKDYQGQVIVLDKEWKKISQKPMANLTPVATLHDLAYIIYTSGSTGKPKGVLIENKSVVNYSQWFAEYSGCQQQRIDFSANYIFDMAVTSSIVALMLGLTIVICEDAVKKNFRQYLNFLAYYNVNIIKIAPSYFKMLLHELKASPVALPHLETLILGGENLPTADCAAWFSLYPHHRLINEYGPTEATVAVSQFSLHYSAIASLGANVPIGHLGPHMYAYILDSDNMPVSEGAIGELYIGGVCLARGYLNHNELTQQQFIPDPFSDDTGARLYKTGDLCRRLADGAIEYSGRKDDQIKIRGFRIEPAEIETALATHKAIDEAVVLAREDGQKEKCLIAYYMLKSGSIAPSVKQLRHYLQRSLPAYMLPTLFVTVDAFPLTPNGKLDRSALPLPQFSASEHYKAPRTLLAKKLAKIWSEELGVTAIGMEDDFFELGGHSLTAARIVSKINSELEKDISLQDFYHATTLTKLVLVVKNSKKVAKKRGVNQKTKQDASRFLPLSDFQFILWISNTFEPKAKKMNIISRERMEGPIDMAALTFAFEALFKKHEILFYRVLTFRPAQVLQKNLRFTIVEKNLTLLSEQECDLALEASLKELRHYYPWDKDAPMIIARLFHMKEEVAELQLCTPHIVSDDVAPSILLADLSRFYLLYKKPSSIKKLSVDKQYRDYIYNEQHYFETNSEKDLQFWEAYLKEAGLFAFPPEQVVKDMEAEGFSYSTYLEVPEHGLSQLQQFCAKNHVSIKDGLCAAVALALSNCCYNYQGESKPTFMSIVKSTRDNQGYDDTVGCFLRLEPIKVDIHAESTLTTLSQQIHAAAIETEPYQRCSGLIKLASISTMRLKRKIVRHYLISLFTYLYTIVFRTPVLNRKVLNLCGRLRAFERNNNFVININVWNNFIASGKRNSDFNPFGLKSKKIKIYQYDLIKINNFFDVCFLRDDNQNTPYVVISANLRPAIRELIARELVRIITHETTNRLTSLPGVVLNEE